MCEIIYYIIYYVRIWMISSNYLTTWYRYPPRFFVLQ